MNELRVGIVGWGRMGKLHADAWRRISGVEVAAVVDRHTTGSQDVGVAHLATPTDLIGRVDIAVVATPTPNHVETALELLTAGVHCLVEKPLAPTEVEARVLAETAMRHDALLAVGHSERFNPSVVRAMRALGTSAQSADTCIATVRRDAECSARASSDVVSDLLVHDIDWVLHALGEQPVDVAIQSAHLGAVSLQQVACDLHFSHGRWVRMSADHRAGVRNRGVVLFPETHDEEVVSFDSTVESEADDAVTQQARAFVAALSGTPSDLATGWDAVRTAAVVDLIQANAARMEQAL